mmetsp:Transcript_40964/g.86082  ORF Transcript_40964/g.86082 Transcript_40964/m.86082 type:complete len:297 (-) Transcript_40964:200-1090(-)
MKVFYPTAFAIVSSIARAENNHITRGLRRAGGHGGGHGHGFGNGGRGGHQGPPFMEDIELECDPSACEGVADEASLDCEFERPNFAGMTAEEKQEAWANKESMREARWQQMQLCVCCTSATIEDLLPRLKSLEDSVSSSGDGFGMHGHAGGGMDHIDSGAAMHSYQNHGWWMHADGNVQSMFNEQCPEAVCTPSSNEEDPENNAVVECTWRKSRGTKAERLKNAVRCICCGKEEDGEDADLEESDEEVAVILSSLMTDESNIVQSQESLLENRATFNNLSLAPIMFAAVSFVFALV